jgi:class 3 adenylate cyclase
MTAPRRLAAILAVDVVGYSRLTGEDEAGTAPAGRVAFKACEIYIMLTSNAQFS